MIMNLHPDDGLTPEYVQAGQERARSMLRRACTLEVAQERNYITVRVINETGHKLPSGYPEGRRIWINVQFRDVDGVLVWELGHYDAATADLTAEGTTVFEVDLGVDEAISKATGVLEGKGFHFALNNVVLKDNRIPPRGFTKTAFKLIGASPVGETYADGQYWHDSRFRLPPGTTDVTVRLIYQTASKEFITFLRDENTTNQAGNILYAQWELTGKSPPEEMANVNLVLAPFATGDFDADGDSDLADGASMVSCYSGPGAPAAGLGCGVFDYDEDGDVDLADTAEFLLGFQP
jgi:hypothetical protein